MIALTVAAVVVVSFVLIRLLLPDVAARIISSLPEGLRWLLGG